MVIKYTMECDHCGERFTAQRILDLTQDDEGSVEIDLQHVGGFSATCPDCGCEFYIPDLQDYIEVDDSDCYDNDEDEDYDDQDYDEDQDSE